MGLVATFFYSAASHVSSSQVLSLLDDAWGFRDSYSPFVEAIHRASKGGSFPAADGQGVNLTAYFDGRSLRLHLGDSRQLSILLSPSLTTRAKGSSVYLIYRQVIPCLPLLLTYNWLRVI